MAGPVSAKRIYVQARRISRNPAFRRAMRSSNFVRRHFVRATMISMVPSALDDVMIHHKAFTAIDAIDSMTVSTMSAVASILLAAAKL